MVDIRDWIKGVTKRRITAEEIAEILGVSRTTVTRRLQDGMPAEDVIAIARACGASPVQALSDLDYVTVAEVMDFLDDPDAKLLEAATDGELAIELAKRLEPTFFQRAARLGRRISSVRDESTEDNVHVLTSRSQPISLDDLEGLPYVAMTKDDRDPGDDVTDHDYVP
ncbi:immunity repressor [Rhodococcus phage Sleepyhead]|uniref:Immunity repressor n=1 Tax=Rhodococcus phage Sleepyhead TaxID=2591131 RepID=A0A515MH98_9CAUD|nr:transcriptional repressor [Rhodococcus phage Sleepyhead]QDM56055.1 immunity repressor [Rhodococcus phage Sleepyhead]